MRLAQITRSWGSYDVDVNKYKVKCGGTLDMWESSGWISPIDPYGWFQWYPPPANNFLNLYTFTVWVGWGLPYFRVVQQN